MIGLLVRLAKAFHRFAIRQLFVEKQWFAARHRSGWSVNDFVDGPESQYPLAVYQSNGGEER